MLASLERQPELPIALRLEIEEAVETAWALAYRRPETIRPSKKKRAGGVVVLLSFTKNSRADGRRSGG